VSCGRRSGSDCCAAGCGEAGCGETVVSGCDAPEVFQPAEDALDGVATAVERGAEAALAAPVCLRRDVSSGHLRFVLRTPSVLGTAAGASIAPQKRSASKARSAITRAPSGTASIGVSPPRRSAVLPPERWNAIGLPAWFAAAWILLVRPPRGGPHRGLPRWVPRPPDGLRVLPPFPPEALRCAFASVASRNT
jgi:hypothetical protein